MKDDREDYVGMLATILACGLVVGVLLAMAVFSAGCAHRSMKTTQEATRTTWTARETTTATSTATTAKVAASRKFTIRRRVHRAADGSSTETTTTTTTDSGETSTTAQAGVSAHVSTVAGEAASQSKQTKQSETRTRWGWWTLAGLVAGLVYVGFRWGPGLWARVLGVFRRG